MYSKIIPKNFKSRLVRIIKEMSDRRKLVKQMQQNSGIQKNYSKTMVITNKNVHTSCIWHCT
jgi:hypothetical protein